METLLQGIVTVVLTMIVYFMAQYVGAIRMQTAYDIALMKLLSESESMTELSIETKKGLFGEMSVEIEITE